MSPIGHLRTAPSTNRLIPRLVITAGFRTYFNGIPRAFSKLNLCTAVLMGFQRDQKQIITTFFAKK